MSNGVDHRKEIDTETVKGLQFVNGGLAAALASIFPLTIQNQALGPLSLGILLAFASCACGLISAIIHNRLRRKCSLEYAKTKDKQESPFGGFLSRFQSSSGEPGVCTLSTIWMWTSLFMFFLGCLSVFIGGARVMGVESAQNSSTCWHLITSEDRTFRFNSCTGIAEAYSLPDIGASKSVKTNNKDKMTGNDLSVEGKEVTPALMDGNLTSVPNANQSNALNNIKPQ